MTATPTSFTRRRAWSWMLRVVGLGGMFLVAAAPLPGDSPGCGDESPEIDDSPALEGAGFVRVLCGERCYADCHLLIAECGRYTEAQRGRCYEDCIGREGRNCDTQTFDSLCPLDRYGAGRVITMREKEQCLSDTRNAGCWCAQGQDCFGPDTPTPVSCTPSKLCDPRYLP